MYTEWYLLKTWTAAVAHTPRCFGALCCAVVASSTKKVGLSDIVGVLTLTRIIIKYVVTGQGSVTLELSNTPEKHTHTNQRWYTNMSQLTQSMPPPNTYKNWSRESAFYVPGPYWCTYVSLLAPEITDYLVYRLLPLEDYHVYITGSTYHYACPRQTQANQKKNVEKKRKEEKGRKENITKICKKGNEIKDQKRHYKMKQVKGK